MFKHLPLVFASLGTNCLASSDATKNLIVMPLGASITAGAHSSTGDGYRLDLRNSLQGQGYSVTYAGKYNNGSMSNNNITAVAGYTIGEVDNLFKDYINLHWSTPNVILINAGNNNCIGPQKETLDKSEGEYTTLLSNIKQDLPDALVVVSTLLRNINDPTANQCNQDLNQGILSAASKAKSGGQKIATVDMFNVVPTQDYYSDGEHPVDAGYQCMSDAWFETIQDAASQIPQIHPQ